MLNLQERGLGRVIGYATGGPQESTPQGHAFMFALPHRSSNGVRPEKEVLLVSPYQNGYRFCIVTPKPSLDQMTDYEDIFGPSKEPYLFTTWRSETGIDAFSEFLKYRRLIIPSIGNGRELISEPLRQRAWGDAVGLAEALAKARGSSYGGKPDETQSIVPPSDIEQFGPPTEAGGFRGLFAELNDSGLGRAFGFKVASDSLWEDPAFHGVMYALPLADLTNRDVVAQSRRVLLIAPQENSSALS